MGLRGIKPRQDWLMLKEYIREELTNGVTLDALGAEFGVSRQRMYQVISDLKLETNRTKTKALNKLKKDLTDSSVKSENSSCN